MTRFAPLRVKPCACDGSDGKIGRFETRYCIRIADRDEFQFGWLDFVFVVCGNLRAQATDHSVALNWLEQLTLLGTLLITSKGIAGVARASLIILMGTIGQFGIPEWSIYLILGVDVLMDMVQTGTNMLGNCLATVVIAKWEGEDLK